MASSKIRRRGPNIEDPVLECVDYRKEWRIIKQHSKENWADCEIIITVNESGNEELTVIKDGIKVCSWTKTGFSIKPLKKRN